MSAHHLWASCCPKRGYPKRSCDSRRGGRGQAAVFLGHRSALIIAPIRHRPMCPSRARGRSVRALPRLARVWPMQVRRGTLANVCPKFGADFEGPRPDVGRSGRWASSRPSSAAGGAQIEPLAPKPRFGPTSGQLRSKLVNLASPARAKVVEVYLSMGPNSVKHVWADCKDMHNRFRSSKGPPIER